MCRLLGDHDPMGTHERTKWCGRRMLKQNTWETVLAGYIYRKLNVFIQAF